jgi:hypothetical protein
MWSNTLIALPKPVGTALTMDRAIRSLSRMQQMQQKTRSGF